MTAPALDLEALRRAEAAEARIAELERELAESRKLSGERYMATCEWAQAAGEAADALANQRDWQRVAEMAMEDSERYRARISKLERELAASTELSKVRESVAEGRTEAAEARLADVTRTYADWLNHDQRYLWSEDERALVDDLLDDLRLALAAPAQTDGV